jgi:EAL domain-containing protein (putative c-di-GMP-specific phosphodiesterase class I)/CheY-like chemotaxis protein
MFEGRARILIVDDDDEIRNVLLEFLSGSNSCVAVEAAGKALALLATQQFDLILSDIKMARMTGLEMLRRIPELAPDTVSVMISGQRRIECAIDAMRAGAFDYVTKPFELREVADVVRRALAHRKSLLNSRSEGAASQFRASELRTAIARQEFVVYYQPQVEIRSRHVVGAEALLRWRHPQRGLLLPADIVPFAETNELIDQIGAWVLDVACTQTRRWQIAGLDRFRIAVNASPLQLRAQTFPDVVEQALENSCLSADCLEIEVTETSLMQDSGSGIETLKRLRDMGVRIAIDDFGIGYSSLAYLKRLPVDSVKLDASFVKDSTTDADDAALVMAIITLGHTLGKTVIAEGIEREDQLALLKLLRCDNGQGYLWGKPAAAEDMTPLLMSSGFGQLPAAA